MSIRGENKKREDFKIKKTGPSDSSIFGACTCKLAARPESKWKINSQCHES